MILSVFFILKVLLFLNITRVEFNRIPIFIITSMITILIISLINQSKLKGKNILILLFYTLVSLILFIDGVYFSYFNGLPSITMLNQAKQLTAVKDIVVELIDFKKVLLILDIPVAILIYKLLANKDHKNFISTRLQFLTIIVVLGATIIYVNATGKIQSLIMQEPYLYHTMDIINSFKPSNMEEAFVFTDDDLLGLKKRTELEDGELTGIGRGKNLIVLQVEALQNFVIDLKYNGQEITPNLNRLIKDKSSVYYNRYYQLLGRGNTSDAEFVTQNSLYPSMEEPTYVQYENNTFYGLPWLLRDHGYTSWVFHGYKKDFWNRDRAYVNQGFQRFISEEDFEFNETIGLGLRDEDFFKQSIEYLKELDEIDDNPFYAFMITLSSHTPFNIQNYYHELDIEEKYKDTMLGNYLQSIHYVDNIIGRFIEDLKREGLYDNTVIAIYGDHFAVKAGVEANDKLMTDFLGFPYDFDTMMNVPLIIHVPGEDINRNISTVGSQLDFYPTILNIMGYKNEKGIMFGRDITNYKGENYVFSQTYMLKGSFIGNDVVFEMSRDGVFDHSRVYSLSTRERLKPIKFRSIYNTALEEINKSDFILKNNLLKDYVK